MNIKKQYIALFSLTALLTACSEKDMLVDDPSTGSGTDAGKTAIELSVGGVDAPAMTRAVITDGTNKTMKNFDVNTKIFMVIKSEKDATTHDGYEYKGDRLSPLYTVCRGDVDANTNSVKFDATNQHYWDDAHARSSMLSIWAYAQKGENWNDCYFQEIIDDTKSSLDAANVKKCTTGSTYYDWQTKEIYPVIREWNAMLGNNTIQTTQTVRCQDLLFSNNLTYNSEKSWSDNRLKFSFTTHKFPNSNEMKFYHAMSKITIQIKAGDGFKADGTDFALANNKSIDQLVGFNTKGLFNIKDGEFQMIHECTTITSIPLLSEKTGKSDPNYVLEALAIPNIHQFMVSQRTTELPNLSDENSRFVDGSKAVMLQFTIDNNTYKISSDALFDAITGKANATTLTDNGTYVPLEAGKNYVFTFTVSKTKISGITAQVAEWETVTADNVDASNARISLMLEERGDYVDTGVDFYRAKDAGNTAISDTYKGYQWATGYDTDGKATETSCTNYKWKTPNWYWPDNATFYHFRALSPITQTITNATNDYTSLTAGESYTDVRWGAPMLDDKNDETAGSFKFYYDTTNGFDATGTGSPNASHQIYHGIGPTNADIKLIMFHMMSDVTFKVKTKGDSDPAKVDLGTGDDNNCTTIKLEKIYKSGKVNIGNGLVEGVLESGTSEKEDYSFTSHPAPADGVITWANYGAIPQSLEDVVLVITTPDHNEYRIDMKDVVATVPSYNQVSYPTYSGNKVNYWYPGVKYTYTFTLSKKKIENITATILDWETIEASYDNVQIR